jgi:hypothetical protein
MSRPGFGGPCGGWINDSSFSTISVSGSYSDVHPNGYSGDNSSRGESISGSISKTFSRVPYPGTGRPAPYKLFLLREGCCSGLLSIVTDNSATIDGSGTDTFTTVMTSPPYGLYTETLSQVTSLFQFAISTRADSSLPSGGQFMISMSMTRGNSPGPANTSILPGTISTDWMDITDIIGTFSLSSTGDDGDEGTYSMSGTVTIG